MLHHHSRLREEWFAYLDGLWDPHTIHRFATAENRQPLCQPHSGQFCSEYWHPDSEWVDALSLPWGAENNWVFLPVHLVGAAVTHLRACRAVATSVCPHCSWATWWPCLRARAPGERRERSSNRQLVAEDRAGPSTAHATQRVSVEA